MHPAQGLEFKKIVDRYVGIPLIWGCHAWDEMASLWRKPNPLEVKNILLCKLWGIGNLVMIMPFLESLRRRFPDASLSFLTIESNRSLLEKNPYLDQVYTIRTRGSVSPLFDIVRLVPRLRRQRFDLFLDFEQFLRVTAILGFLSKSHQRIGLATPGQGRAPLFHAKVPYRRDRHMTEVFGDVVRSAGVEVKGLRPLSVPRCEEGAKHASDFIEKEMTGTGPLVAIHPGSGDHFPGRRWPPERFATLADQLVKTRGARIIITGTESESSIVDRVCAAMHHRGVTVAGRFPIESFIELIAQIDLIVSNDTAPVHIASALGTPVVAIYGPNTPELYGPLHRASRSVYNKLPCSPCLSNLSAKTSNCRLPACILGVEVDQVLIECESLLLEPTIRSATL